MNKHPASRSGALLIITLHSADDPLSGEAMFNVGVEGWALCADVERAAAGRDDGATGGPT